MVTLTNCQLELLSIEFHSIKDDLVDQYGYSKELALKEAKARLEILHGKSKCKQLWKKLYSNGKTS